MVSRAFLNVNILHYFFLVSLVPKYQLIYCIVVVKSDYLQSSSELEHQFETINNSFMKCYTEIDYNRSTKPFIKAHS